MRRYLYNNSKGELYSSDKFIPPIYSLKKEHRDYIGSVNIHNECALESFVEWVTSWAKYTEEDILKALKVEKYQLISKKLIEVLKLNKLATMELVGNTEDGKKNILQNIKEDGLFTEEGIEILGGLLEFEMFEELFKENDDE